MMKRIGLIGGIGWASTVDYYRLINQMTAKKLGNDHAANLVLVNLDSGVIRKLAEEGKEEEIYQLLLGGAKTLVNAEVQLLAMCANGVHRFYDQLRNEIPVKIIHIAKETAAAVKNKGIKKVALLGIKKTMEGTFYQDILAKEGIETIVPNESDRNFIDRTVYEELMNENFSPRTKEKYLQIIEGLVKAGSEGVILGCTEIPLLIKQSDVRVPVFSTTEIHCEAIVAQAFQS